MLMETRAQAAGNEKEVKVLEAQLALANDPGSYASALGYDAILVPEEETGGPAYMVILNRGMVVVEKWSGGRNERS